MGGSGPGSCSDVQLDSGSRPVSGPGRNGQPLAAVEPHKVGALVAAAAASFAWSQRAMADDSMADELAALIESAGDSVNQFEVRGTAPPPPPLRQACSAKPHPPKSADLL